MSKLRLLLPFALLALVLGLAACGGGGDGEEDRIVEVIEASATGDDPANCKKLSTQKFLEQTQYAKGQEAVKGCEEDAKDTEGDTDSIEASNVVVEDSTATADASFEGGTFDGQTLSVALVKEDGDWKLDEITGFAELDQERLAESIQENLEQGGQNALKPAEADCVRKAFTEMGEAELEKAFFGGSPQQIGETIEGCAQG